MSATGSPPPAPPQGGPRRLAEDIYATAGDEITCSEAGRLIGLAADLLLSDAETQARFPALFHHLQFCPDCTEEYRMVSDYARREAAGQLRTPANIPPLPDEFRAAPSRAGRILAAIFSGFTPLTPQQALRGGSERWQAEIDLGGGRQLHIEAQTSSTSAERRTLSFKLSGVKTDGAEGARTLRLETDGEVEQEATLEAPGEATLREVSPGDYQLRLLLAGQEHLIKAFVIP